VLLAIGLAGALTRQFFVLRQKGRNAVWLPAGATAVIALLIWAGAPERGAATAEAPPFAEVQAIIASHCASCHAARPTDEAFAAPPKGVMLETPQQIRRWAAATRQQVQTEAMPPGNLTGITAEERARLVAWVVAGAPAE
jgi:uncharacterized membrane protein